MKSFELRISPQQAAGGRHISQTHRELVSAAAEQKRKYGFKQKDVAKTLGLTKSTISKLLSGNGNLTLRTIGELCWALDLKPVVKFVDLREQLEEQHERPNSVAETSVVKLQVKEYTDANAPPASTASSIRREMPVLREKNSPKLHAKWKTNMEQA